MSRVALTLTFLAGCGQAPLQAIDLGGGKRADMALPEEQPPVDMATSNPTPDLAQAGCSTYTPQSIATMRQGKSGCYELDNAVTLAVTPVSTNTRSVTIHVQDAAGGDYSAVKLLCSSTSTSHMCTAFPSAKNILAGRKVTVQGLYIKSSAAKGGYEAFEIDSITDNGSASAPAAASLTESDLERGATMTAGGKPTAAYWFQIVSANVGDKLVMFDWTPPELERSGGGTGCPQQFGFGMIPTSAGASAGAACNGMTQPAGQTTVNAKEVLLSTDYYTGFTVSSDCACAFMGTTTLTSGMGTTGSIKAILDYDVPYGSTTGYQYLAPLSSTDFPVK